MSKPRHCVLNLFAIISGHKEVISGHASIAEFTREQQPHVSDRFQDHHWQKIEENWKASIEQERLRQLRSPGSQQQQRQPSAYSESSFRPTRRPWIRARFNLD